MALQRWWSVLSLTKVISSVAWKSIQDWLQKTYLHQRRLIVSELLHGPVQPINEAISLPCENVLAIYTEGTWHSVESAFVLKLGALIELKRSSWSVLVELAKTKRVYHFILNCNFMGSFRIDEKQQNGSSLMKTIVTRRKVLAATFVGAIFLSVVSWTFVELDVARLSFLIFPSRSIGRFALNTNPVPILEYHILACNFNSCDRYSKS